MKHSSTRFKLAQVALAAAASALGLTPQAQAAVEISRAQMQVSNVKYQLLDLNSADGISPSVKVHGGLSTSTYQIGVFDRTETSGYPNLGIEGQSTPAPVSGDLFDPSSQFSYTSANGANTISLNDRVLTMKTIFTSDNLTTVSAQQTWGEHRYIDYNESIESYVERTTLQTDTVTVSAGGQGMIAHSSANASETLDGNLNVTMTLSPHTMITITGQTTGSTFIDRSQLNAAVANLGGMNQFPGAAPVGESEYLAGFQATGNAYSNFQIYLSEGDNNVYTQSAATQFISSDYSSGNLGDIDLPSGQVITSLTDSKSSDLNWRIYLVNQDDIARDVSFSFIGEVIASQSFTHTVSAYNTTERPVIFDPETGGWIDAPAAIPEPSTYALMGLGLLGIALVRHRQAV
jgi:PEP-CTERM motif